MLSETELTSLIGALQAVPRYRLGGHVTGCLGGVVTVSGLNGLAGIGDPCLIERRRSNAPAALFDDKDFCAELAQRLDEKRKEVYLQAYHIGREK